MTKMQFLKNILLYNFEMIFYELQTGFCGQEILILEINVMYIVDEKLNVL